METPWLRLKHAMCTVQASIHYIAFYAKPAHKRVRGIWTGSSHVHIFIIIWMNSTFVASGNVFIIAVTNVGLLMLCLIHQAKWKQGRSTLRDVWTFVISCKWHVFTYMIRYHLLFIEAFYEDIWIIILCAGTWFSFEGKTFLNHKQYPHQ